MTEAIYRVSSEIASLALAMTVEEVTMTVKEDAMTVKEGQKSLSVSLSKGRG